MKIINYWRKTNKEHQKCTELKNIKTWQWCFVSFLQTACFLITSWATVWIKILIQKQPKTDNFSNHHLCYFYLTLGTWRNIYGDGTSYVWLSQNKLLSSLFSYESRLAAQSVGGFTVGIETFHRTAWRAGGRTWMREQTEETAGRVQGAAQG